MKRYTSQELNIEGTVSKLQDMNIIKITLYFLLVTVADIKKVLSSVVHLEWPCHRKLSLNDSSENKYKKLLCHLLLM